MTIIIALTVGVGIFSIYLISTTFGYIYNFNLNTNKYFIVNSLLQNNTENDRLIGQYIDDFKMETLAEFNESVDSFYSNMTEIEEEAQSLDAYLLLRSINNSFTYYLEECNEAIRKKSESNVDYLVHYYNAVRINEYLENYINQLLELALYEGNMEYNELVTETEAIRLVSIGVVSALIIAYIVAGSALSNSITKPIKHLAEQSKRISAGDMEVEMLQIETNDEVGTLTRSFNKMSASIKSLIDDLKEKAKLEKKLMKEELINVKNKELLKEAKFLALQSQINPHFLFNTLNTISREVTFGNRDEAVQLIESMSNLLRYNMSNGEMYVTLEEEIEIVKQYFHIQQHRFKERLRVDIQIAGLDISKVVLPSFTLQPIVENAIIHGLEPKVEGGMIRIKAYNKKGCAVIKVIDNGVGIEADRLKTIINRKSGRTNSIGVTNVRDRVKIFCGNRKCFEIFSKAGLGTCVVISIPWDKEAKLV